jgi:predicted methyltransferase
MQITKILMLFLLLTLLGCGEAPAPAPQQTTDGPGGAPAASMGSIYEDAVASPGRTDADRLRDAGRKPAEILKFFGIAPGMTVLDMFSGGGYYTEMLSHVVGPAGKVVAHTNSAYAEFVGDEAVNRYAENRLANVENLLAENNELRLPAAEFDAVMLILAYHDIYYVDAANGWPKIDGPEFLAELKKGLKPGGVLAVVDHYAAAGSPRETGGSLHRIDPQIVISELEAEGFMLEAKSDVLRNMEDDYSKGMFDPEVRGKTDRFVLKFRKPEE